MIKGSHTVEFALLAPFIMGTIIFILSIIFYFYNAGIMKIAAYFTALEEENHRNCEYEKQEKILENFGENILKGKLLGMKEISISVKVSDTRCMVAYEGKLSMPFLTGTFLPDSSVWTISIKEESKRMNLKNWIQNVRRITNLKENWAGEKE